MLGKTICIATKTENGITKAAIIDYNSAVLFDGAVTTENRDRVQALLDGTDNVIVYGCDEVEDALKGCGVNYNPDETPGRDMAADFADVNGEWDWNIPDTIKQPLEKCADFYNYPEPITDALSACRAVLHSYKMYVEWSFGGNL